MSPISGAGPEARPKPHEAGQGARARARGGTRFPSLLIDCISRPEDPAPLREAETLLQEALKETPDTPALLLALADLYVRMRRFELAANAYARTLSVAPSEAAAYARLGALMWHMGRADDSIGFFDCALNFDPGNVEALINRLTVTARMADWSEPEAREEQIARLKRSAEAIPPAATLCLKDDPGFHLAQADRFAAALPRSAGSLHFATAPQDRLRIGYVGDLTQGNAAWRALVAAHDADRTEVICYDLGADSLDMAGVQRGKGPLHRPVQHLTDEAVMQIARDDGIDLALDLDGLSARGRPGLMALRLAPLQIGGFTALGPMGGDMLDYMLSDPHLIPQDLRAGLSAQCLDLPSGAQFLGPAAAPDTHCPDRQMAGLPAGGIVFGVPAPLHLIDPVLFACWMRLLRQVPGSALWMRACPSRVRARLRAQAEEQGVAGDRLVFGWLGVTAERGGQTRAADLVLDCRVQSDRRGVNLALLHGVPVVTLAGRSVSARHAAGLLHQLDMPELVADRIEDYEGIALSLAQEADLRADVQVKLAQAHLASPLFNAAYFVEELEAALRLCRDRVRDGHPPGGISSGAMTLRAFGAQG
ncbi:MAG: hypothetical protein HRU31_17180 [Rhodobacteraceae bacterium]|nr:hypothetical protein [Paracoccaceae bacterium]